MRVKLIIVKTVSISWSYGSLVSSSYLINFIRIKPSHFSKNIDVIKEMNKSIRESNNKNDDILFYINGC